MHSVLHICRDLEYRGGVEVVLFEFLRHNTQYHHTLVATEGAPGNRTERLRKNDVEVVYVNGNFFNKVRKINAIVRNMERPPILHCHLFRPECMGLFVRGCHSKITTKYCTYASDSQVGHSVLGWLRRQIDNIIFDRLVTLVFSHVIVITEELERKWRWLPGFLHLVEISTLTEYADARPPKKLDENMTLIVATRMVAEKDHFLLIEALSQTRFGKLYLLGDGPLRLSILKGLWAAGISNVDMPGAVPRSVLFEYMRRSDVMLLTSRTEGLPLLIQEAMSMGVIVVATDVGGNRRLVDQTTGRLVGERSPKAIADAINSLIGCDTGAMGNAAIERSRNFSLFETIRAINKIYEQVDIRVTASRRKA